jgi:hypothetical protein
MIQEFKNLLEHYDNIKHLEYYGISLEDYIETFTKKYSSNMVGGKYVKPMQDLTDDFETSQDIYSDCGKDIFKYILIDLIKEYTRRGERGGIEYSEKFLIHGRVYEVKMSDIDWIKCEDFYYIDDETCNIEIKLLN